MTILIAFLAGLLFSKLIKYIRSVSPKHEVSVCPIHSEYWWVLDDTLLEKERTKKFFVIVCSSNKSSTIINAINKDSLLFGECDNPSLNSTLYKIWSDKQVEFIEKP